MKKWHSIVFEENNENNEILNFLNFKKLKPENIKVVKLSSDYCKILYYSDKA